MVGPPLNAVATAPLVEQSNVNQDEVTLTGSLNVTVRLEPIGKFVAPFNGKVVATEGAASATSSLRIVPLPWASTTAAPVSYTHLRAHETVLDLVCRLLLEKKKNKRTYNLFSTTT